MIKRGMTAITALLALAAPATAATPPALYTAQQADAGAATYAQSCAMCHGADLKGGAGPALIGQAFAAPGAQKTIGGTFTLLAQTMPATAPGSLSQSDYENVMAYLLKQNGYPAGSTAFAYKNGLASTTPLVSTAK